MKAHSTRSKKGGTSVAQLKGVLPPMMTPFREDGRVDYTAFERNIDRWNKDNLAGYLVLGSNSESAFLSESEKVRLMRLTVDAARKGRALLAGTGLESARETLRLTEKAAGLGFAGALILTPSYYIDRMDDAALIEYFTFLADRSPIPVLIYNVPKYTHVNVSPNVVRELSAHANIAGMKDSKGDIAQVEAFVQAAASGFKVIVGSASVWYPAMRFGVTAGIVALSNFAGNQCAQIQALFDAGRTKEAEALHATMLSVNTAITSTFGVPGLKYAATLAGYEGGHVRLPLRPLDEESKNNIRDTLLKAGILH